MPLLILPCACCWQLLRPDAVCLHGCDVLFQTSGTLLHRRKQEASLARMHAPAVRAAAMKGLEVVVMTWPCT